MQFVASPQMKVSFFPRPETIFVRFGGPIKLSHPKDFSTCQRPFWGINPVVDSGFCITSTFQA